MALPSHMVKHPEAFKHAICVCVCVGGQDVYVWVHLNYQHLTDQDLDKLVAITTSI